MITVNRIEVTIIIKTVVNRNDASLSTNGIVGFEIINGMDEKRNAEIAIKRYLLHNNKKFPELAILPIVNENITIQ